MESENMKPGVHVDIPVDEYHADKHSPEPSLSSSIAKILVTRSPLHAYMAHPRLNTKHEREEKESFDLGTAVHDALLESGSRIEYIDPLDFPGAKGGIPDGWTNAPIRAARDACYAAGRTPVLLKYKEPIDAMVANALAAIETCDHLEGRTLADGTAEQSVFWTEGTEEEGQIWCRSRPDWMSHDRRVQVSVKSTATSANPSLFNRQYVNLGYDLQDAFYLRGNRATGAPEDCVNLTLVMENTPPYACVWFALTPEFMSLGEEKVDEAMEIWRRCIGSGRWPAYPRHVHFIEAPPYSKLQWEERESITTRAGQDRKPRTREENVQRAKLLSAEDLEDGIPL